MGLQEHTWSIASQRGNRWAEVFLGPAILSVFGLNWPGWRSTVAVACMRATLKMPFSSCSPFLPFCPQRSPKPQTEADLKSPFSPFPPEGPHPNRQNRRSHLMRGRWCFLFALNAFGCLHSSNKLHQAIGSRFRLVS